MSPAAPVVGVGELGETLAEALVREMREETHMVVEPREVLTVFDRIEREAGAVLYHFVIVDYLCRWVSGEARAGSDALEVAWVAPGEIGSYDLSAKAVEVVKEAFRRASGVDRGALLHGPEPG